MLHAIRTSLSAAIALAIAAPALAQTSQVPTAPAAADATTAPRITGTFERGAQVASGEALVSAADPRASEAGAEMLRAGGSAADAAVATMLALTVVEPQSSGIGGGGFFVYRDDKGEVTTIDGREVAPAAARATRFLGANGRAMGMDVAVPGGLSVGVPGSVALAAEVHRRHGRLPWAQLFAPAIRLARQGYTVSPWLAASLQGMERRWADFPQMRAIWFIDGRPARAGETIRNPALAATLELVARRGPSAFYTGPVARQIVAAVRSAPRNPGDMTEADLAAYRVAPRDALCTTYRAHRICTMGPPSSGGTTVFAMLGMLEGYDLKAMGPTNPMSWHVMREAMRLAYADRDLYVGDPGFVDVPTAGLIDRGYLAGRARLISPFRALERVTPGTPPGAQPRTPMPTNEVPSTSHFVAVDRAGGVASWTNTVEGVFGSQLVAGGMVLNNELTDFSLTPTRADGAPVANRVEPGKRPRSSMTPTIVFAPDGRPLMAVGSAGGPRIIMHVLKSIVGVVDFELPVDQALALPNLYMAGDGDIIENTQLGRTLAPQLAPFGRTIVTAELGSKINAALAAPDGRWTGAADPRSVGAVSIAATGTPRAPAPPRR